MIFDPFDARRQVPAYRTTFRTSIGLDPHPHESVLFQRLAKVRRERDTLRVRYEASQTMLRLQCEQLKALEVERGLWESQRSQLFETIRSLEASADEIERGLQAADEATESPELLAANEVLKETNARAAHELELLKARCAKSRERARRFAALARQSEADVSALRAELRATAEENRRLAGLVNERPMCADKATMTDGELAKVEDSPVEDWNAEV
jgi:predicted  nucleic acid-binding Zn-ribbon protein